MKKFFALVAIMLIAQQFAQAQNLKFGKPSQDEWALTSCEEAPDAPAVVLCKTLSVTYNLSTSFSSYSNESDIDLEGSSVGHTDLFTNEGTSMTYNVRMRTKILKDEGRDYADMDILYFYSEDDMNMRDEFYSFKVMLFSMVNGKVKKQSLDKSCFKDEHLGKDYMVRRVRIPQAKAGDIIEVQYELFSLRNAYIFDWQMQDEIPVRYSLCEMNIPSFLNFNVNAAIRPNIKSTVTQGIIQFKSDSNDYTTPKKCYSNVYRIESWKMLPWSLDPIREKQGAEVSQIKCTINNATIKGIPYPMSQPEGTKWITIGRPTPSLP